MEAELLEPLSPGVGEPFARGLPSGLVMVEAAAAAFAAWLDLRGRGAWSIFQTNVNVDELAEHAGDDRPAPWVALAPLSGVEAGTIDRLFERREGFVRHPSGACLLDPHPVAIGRWYWVNSFSGEQCSLTLVAAPDQAAVARAVDVARRRMHDAAHARWQILRGSYVENETTSRHAVAADAMIVPPALSARVERDLVGFFRPEVAAMYRALGVPHRRGALLYGPPGNGKTSLIRAIGGRLPSVSAMILRANATFDSDDLEFAIDLWTKQAPAMLVIEDLNWLMDRVNVSTFLNLLDGIDTPDAPGGLLLIASTNHPDRLDAALSNRPGRFDVTIELPPPDAATRLRYFERHASCFDARAVARFAADADGLSFAHLAEVVRLAGLIALNDGREARTGADVTQAIEIVQAGRREADDGFRGAPPAFGLHTLVKQA